MKEIPLWCQNFLNAEDLKSIESAVKIAEQDSSAEIVPMIVQRSSTFRHVYFTYILIGAVIALWCEILYLKLPKNFSSETVEAAASWGASYIPFYIFGLFLAWVVLAPKVCEAYWLQRYLTPKSDLEFQVWERAELEFHRLSMRGTEHKTGVLIFVSLMEHQAVVLGDEAIQAKYKNENWQEILDKLLAGIKNKQAADGFVTAIQLAGEMLTKTFPAEKSRNDNELSDRLVIKD